MKKSEENKLIETFEAVNQPIEKPSFKNAKGKSMTPIFAIIDHLKGVTHSSALHLYKTLDDAVKAFVEEYGMEQLREFLNQPDVSELVGNKFDEIVKDIEFFAKIQDHNSQTFIEFQDKLNEISVAE